MVLSSALKLQDFHSWGLQSGTFWKKGKKVIVRLVVDPLDGRLRMERKLHQKSNQLRPREKESLLLDALSEAERDDKQRGGL